MKAMAIGKRLKFYVLCHRFSHEIAHAQHLGPAQTTPLIKKGQGMCWWWSGAQKVEVLLQKNLSFGEELKNFKITSEEKLSQEYQQLDQKLDASASELKC